MGARPGGPGLLSLVKTLVMRSIKFIYFKKEGKYFILSSNWDEDQEGPVAFFREGWAIRQWDPGVCVGAGRRRDQGPQAAGGLSRAPNIGEISSLPRPTFFNHPNSQALLKSTVLTTISAALVHWAVLIC